VAERDGKWRYPRERRWPGEMAASSRCRAARPGNCSAGAAYLDASSEYQALVINEVGGQWEAGLKITLPTGQQHASAVDGGVYGLICHATGPCTATGSYLKTLTNYEGFTVTTG